jgi:DNA repair exonuclease SbcCD nuclease subunit
VVRGSDIPEGFAAVLTGHVHRHQALTQDLSGRVLACPVLYPGSTERTSFAEKDEVKGYLEATADHENRLAWHFKVLPTRPMYSISIPPSLRSESALLDFVEETFSRLDPEGIVRLRVPEPIMPVASRILTAQVLRAMAPLSMNVAARYPRPLYKKQ